MELVRDVRQALAPLPADRRQLFGGQRLGNEDIVVHGRDVVTKPVQQRRERIGAEGNAPAAHLTERCGDEHADAVPFESGCLGVLVDANAQRLRCCLKPPREASGIDERRTVAAPQPTEIGGGVDLRAHGGGIQQLDGLAQFPEEPELLAELVEVTGGVECGGHVDDPGALEVAVDAVALDGGLDLIEVAQAEVLEHRELVGEACLAVRDPVGEAGVHEAAVAAAGCRPDLVGLDEDDVTRRVPFLGDDRRPEPGVTATDDAEVAVVRSDQCRIAVGLVGVLVPVRIRVCVCNGVEVSLVLTNGNHPLLIVRVTRKGGGCGPTSRAAVFCRHGSRTHRPSRRSSSRIGGVGFRLGTCPRE